MQHVRLEDTSLYLLGCGKMGSALLQAWLAAGVSPAQVSARTRSRESAAALEKRYEIAASDHAEYAGQDALVLGVKPQDLPALLLTLTGSVQPLYISLAAGVPLARLRLALGEGARILRAMPNTPCKVGKGMTSLAGHGLTPEDKALGEALFGAVGDVLWLRDESQMDAAAAIAGSGPAYLFYLAEIWIEAALSLGFTPDEAKRLVVQTLAGSVALAEAEYWDVARLRAEVTSKGGVTQAALEVMAPALKPLLENALAANVSRAKELAKL